MQRAHKATCFAILLILVIGRWWLTADIASTATYSPHDSSLYVQRASSLLTDGSFGPWTERTLIKLPGFSYLIAAFGALGIDYEIWTLGLWILSATFLLWCLRDWLPRMWQQLTFWLFLVFHPIGFDAGFEVFREKVTLSLTLILFGASLEILRDFGSKLRSTWRVWPWALFALVFSVLRLTREEDRSVLWVQWGLLLVLAGFLALQGKDSAQGWASRLNLKRSLMLLLIPLGMTLSFDWLSRWHIQASYGKALLHDLSEGEYPRLIGALRALAGSETNRHVMLPRASLEMAARVAPEFSQIVETYPRPSQDSYSCQRFAVCSEITNGWSVFFLKDAVQFTGLGADLFSAQQYYAGVAEKIESACRDGSLSCPNRRTSSLLRPPQTLWLPYFVDEMFGQFRLLRDPGFTIPPPPGDQTEDAAIRAAYRHVVSDGEPVFRGSTSMKLVREILVASLRPVTEVLLIVGLLGGIALIFVRSISFELRAGLFLFFTLGYARWMGLAYAATTMGSLDGRLYFTLQLMTSLIGLGLVLHFISMVMNRGESWRLLVQRVRENQSLKRVRVFSLLQIFLLITFVSPTAGAEAELQNPKGSDLLNSLLELQKRDGLEICTAPQVNLGVPNLITVLVLAGMVITVLKFSKLRARRSLGKLSK